MVKLDELLRSCSVRIATSGSPAGSGAFVAPGSVLTCAHVVEAARKGRMEITVHWSGQEMRAEVESYCPKPFPDLALLRIERTDHPCVLLDREIALGDSLYAFGFPDQYPDGDSATLDYEGPSLRPEELHKLKGGQVRPGMSGAALLNRRTGCVCALLKRTRHRGSDLGGRAIPADAVFAAIAGLEECQRRFHADRRTWIDCLEPAGEAASDEPTQRTLGRIRDLLLRLPGWGNGRRRRSFVAQALGKRHRVLDEVEWEGGARQLAWDVASACEDFPEPAASGRLPLCALLLAIPAEFGPQSGRDAEIAALCRLLRCEGSRPTRD